MFDILWISKSVFLHLQHFGYGRFYLYPEFLIKFLSRNFPVPGVGLVVLQSKFMVIIIDHVFIIQKEFQTHYCNITSRLAGVLYISNIIVG